MYTPSTGDGTYWNLSLAEVALVPLGVVTLTSTVPDDCEGLVAEIWVSLSTVKVAPTVPNLTVVAPVKLAPVIVTDVPPLVGPLPGETELTAGADGGGAVYVNWSAGLVALVPPGVVTVTSTVPDPAGLVAEIWMALSTEKLALTVPNLTAVAPLKFAPVIVTGVPPVVTPLFGDTDATVGAGGGGPV